MNFPIANDSKVISIGKDFSEGVAKENIVNAVFAQEHFDFAKQCSSAESYYADGPSTAYMEYPHILRSLDQKRLKILDIGVGRGESSVYLASKGHQVFSVEPCLEFCYLIEFVSRKFNLDIMPICTVGEMLDKLGEKDFDIVIFNSSLHHCDEPALALNNVRSLLKPGGSIFLCSETQLKLWVSKKKWYELLNKYPEQFGHYGGNEHAYYNWEYVGMLKTAGFTGVQILPSMQFLSPILRISLDFKKNNNAYTKKPENEWKYFIRIAYYYVMLLLTRNTFSFRLFSKWSLIPGHYRGNI